MEEKIAWSTRRNLKVSLLSACLVSPFGEGHDRFTCIRWRLLTGIWGFSSGEEPPKNTVDQVGRKGFRRLALLVTSNLFLLYMVDHFKFEGKRSKECRIVRSLHVR